jgi:hypothetical protein
VVDAVVAHEGCKASKARELIQEAIPTSGSGRSITSGNRTGTLMRARKGNHDRAPVELIRTGDGEKEGE